jgi:hypothetical protein
MSLCLSVSECTLQCIAHRACRVKWRGVANAKERESNNNAST